MSKLSAKPNPFLFISFRAKVTLLLVFSLVLVCVFGNFFIYRFALDSQFDQLREKLKVIAQTAALNIDPYVLSQVPLNREGIQTLPYKVIYEKLEKIRKVNPPIKYIYTMTKTDKEGIWQFMVDPDAMNASEISRGLTAYPGDTYDATRFPEMLKAFNGPTADKRLGVDEWGIVLSGYAPIRDSKGETVAVLGVDMLADDVYALQRQVHQREIFVLIFGILFSLILGAVVSHGITARIENLVEGTRRITEGNLQYQVEESGHDEIRELAHSFNSMAKSLFESRRKTHKYFFRAMQSLVRILEAKDVYTVGHSDRVAEYAKKIALKMELPPTKIEMLHQAAQLHDIGKLGIQKAILNKTEKLTDEEWKIIREHPIVGEDILRPVVFDKEILEMVRSHHEHYNGKGYPDKLQGENINLLAQIISVADSYDAMTSARAYRRAMSKEEAVEEMKRNKGGQFNAKVVDVFLEILQEGRRG